LLNHGKVIMIASISRDKHLPARPSGSMPSPGVWKPTPSAPAVEDIPLDEVRLRRLVGEEIKRVVPMRSEIDLSAAMLADPEFDEHEKKKIA
jgi:hypothetical protein